MAKQSNSAEKRVLWEVRQRYNIQPQKRDNKASGAPKAAPSKSGVTPPKPPRPSSRRGISAAPKKRKIWKKIAVLVVLVIVLSGGVFGYKILAAGNKISTAERSILGQLSDLLFGGGNQLAGEEEGRVNIMLIAIGGEGHSGQNLADTIMVASIKPETGEVALLSIPRDLYVQVPEEDYWSKINAVHAYGESQKKDEGPKVLEKAVEEVTGLPIHYYGRVDFVAFKEIIDSIGGIDINIENTFFDYWHKITFPAGTEHMDGERSLAYVRARYVEGPEGGDFKRAARQQQVLLALREKAFSVNTALDFSALNEILNSLSDNVRTSMQLWEMKRLYEIARSIDQSTVHSSVYTTGPTGVLVGDTEVLGGTPASVLKTKTGDYSETQRIAQNLFTEGKEVQAAPANNTPTSTPEPEQEEEAPPAEDAPKPNVEVRNATTVSGLAKKTGDELAAKDYEVTAIANADTASLAKTTVYIIDEEFAEGAKALATLLKAELKTGLPDSESKTNAAALVVLGDDQK